MKSTYLIALLINFGLFGFLTITLLYIPFEIISANSVHGVMDRFIIYCLCTISFSTILFGNAASYSIIEKTSGILRNLFAYGIHFESIVFTKAAFAAMLGVGSYAFWSILGFLLSQHSDRPFIPIAFLERDLVVGVLITPLVVILIATIHITLSFVFTQFAGLINLALLGVAITTFLNIVPLFNQMTAVGVSVLLFFMVLMLVILGALFFIIKNIQIEYILRT